MSAGLRLVLRNSAELVAFLSTKTVRREKPCRIHLGHFAHVQVCHHPLSQLWLLFQGLCIFLVGSFPLDYVTITPKTRAEKGET